MERNQAISVAVGVGAVGTALAYLGYSYYANNKSDTDNLVSTKKASFFEFFSNSNTEETEESTAPSSEEEPTRKSGFLSATFQELKLVVWPSRQQLVSESIAVILMVTLSAAAIAAVSRFYGWGASHVFR